MEPILSIITTTKNIIRNGQKEDFDLLVKLLGMQTYPNIEHIIIDGASDDGTTDLLNSYQAQEKLKFYSSPDRNKFEAFNKGIQQANGKYISFLSCDDFYHDITALFDMCKFMENDNADFLLSASYCRHPLNFVFLYIPSVFNAFQVMPCPRQAMFFKRDVLINENGFDTEFNYLSEFDLIIRLFLKRYKSVYFDRNFTTYKLGQKISDNPELANTDAKKIFVKNYGKLCTLSDEILEKMVSVSEFPKELLTQLADNFTDIDKATFYEKCEQMHQMRRQAHNAQNEQNK